MKRFGLGVGSLVVGMVVVLSATAASATDYFKSSAKNGVLYRVDVATGKIVVYESVGTLSSPNFYVSALGGKLYFPAFVLTDSTNVLYINLSPATLVSDKSGWHFSGVGVAYSGPAGPVQLNLLISGTVTRTASGDVLQATVTGSGSETPGVVVTKEVVRFDIVGKH